MIANPQSFFRFAAQHYPLLRNLYYRSGLGDADLRELIIRNRTEDDPSPKAQGRHKKGSGLDI